MVFSILTFLYVFLPLCLVCYFIFKDIKSRNIILLIFSLAFYAYGEPKYILLLAATVFVDFCGGLLIERYRGKAGGKVALVLSVVLTLSSLALFKYSDFFAQSVNSAFSFNIPTLGLSLPIGISFYTFQALTYVADVYRGNVPVQKSYYKLLLYVSMFPQLIAGPIVRYSDVNRQLEQRTVTLNSAAAGVVRFSAGLLKKAVIANYSGELCQKLIGGDLSSLSSLGAFVGIVAFSIQIYFDFSGYSDMAIGLGKIFGFDFPENFRYPYCADSIVDFWKRWHITLSSFFKDYVYIPLGGNRRHWAFNMLAVWALTGLWHGASVNFLLWGLYYFFFLMLEKIYIGRRLQNCNAFIRHTYSLLIIILGWAFFYFEDMSRLKAFFEALLFMNNGFVSLTEKTIIINYIVVIVVGVIASMPVSSYIKTFFCNASGTRGGKILSNTVSFAFTVFSLFISTAALVGSSYNPFLYFRF